MSSSTFASKVTDLCLDFFHKDLSKKGKPAPGKEWTVFAAFVMETAASLIVVSAGTGSKCLGQSETCPQGRLVHDSHAEVVARRALRRFLLHEVRAERLKEGSSGVFDGDGLREGVRFHLFTTHVPCGDATIAPKEEDERPPEVKRARLEGDLHRTGAKCLPGMLSCIW